MKKIDEGSRILVFCETKRGVDDLVKYLRGDGWHSVRGIHGDKSQYVIKINKKFRKEIKSLENLRMEQIIFLLQQM